MSVEEQRKLPVADGGIEKDCDCIAQEAAQHFWLERHCLQCLNGIQKLHLHREVII